MNRVIEIFALSTCPVWSLFVDDETRYEEGATPVPAYVFAANLVFAIVFLLVCVAIGVCAVVYHFFRKVFK